MAWFGGLSMKPEEVAAERESTVEASAQTFDLLALVASPGVWVPIASALLGGILALLASVIAIRMTYKKERVLREEEEKRHNAKRALVALNTLSLAYSRAADLQTHIHRQFDQAASEGMEGLEPWAKVCQMVMPNLAPLVLDAEDLLFLIADNKPDLFNDVQSIVRRVNSDIHSAHFYNELRHEMALHGEAASEEMKLGEGLVVSNAFSGKSAVVVQAREQQLNNLLGQIMEGLDKNVPRAFKAAQDFDEAAKGYYGENYPKISLDSDATWFSLG